MNPLALLEDPLRWLLDALHDNVGLTYGWSIVVLTVIVRTALLPLVVKQYSSMRQMAIVAPQLKELQRKYKGNRQKLNEELMKFYQENRINPFSSCLPIVPQIPIFIALYYVLRDFANDATDGTDLSFMWVIPDITRQLDEIGWTAGIIVAIYGLSQLLSTELSATPNMAEAQRKIMRVLPIVIVLFVFQFPVPSGLVLYWMTTNLWTCGQQLVMRHRIGLHLPDPADQAAALKRSSRQKPAEAVATLVEDAEDERPAPRPRRRRGRGAEAGTAVETVEAPEAPDAAMAPEPQDAPEARQAPPPREAPVGGDGNGRAAARSGGGSPARRQPRPQGGAKGSRPAPSSRRTPKKKR